jgi:hypothetical protein
MLTDTQKGVLRDVILTTWGVIGADCFTNDEGEHDESMQFTALEVAELSLDAGRWVPHLNGHCTGEEFQAILAELRPIWGTPKFWAVLTEVMPQVIYGY